MFLEDIVITRSHSLQHNWVLSSVTYQYTTNPEVPAGAPEKQDRQSVGWYIYYIQCLETAKHFARGQFFIFS